MASILVIEDEPILARNICDSVALSGHEAVSVGTGEEGLKAIDDSRPDVILVDYRLPGMDGLTFLRQLRRSDSFPAVIIVTAHGNISTAVEAMKIGANDFLAKPLDLEALQLVINRVLRHQNVTAGLSYFRDRERSASACDRIIGDSKPVRQIKSFVERVASSSALATNDPPSILITGETGTGKDLVARAIHYAGARRDAQFVHVNCMAIPEHLAESELFGHVKGAFTDARGDKRGLIEVAAHGTLFLDEIGHMPPALQAKLLTMLDQRTIRPVGSTRERKVDVHIIAATNRNLQEAIDCGEFREDLYHRLRVLTVAMPRLRDRDADVELLSRHFLHACAVRFGVRLTGFSDDAVEAIRAYDWPGNVRELMHTIESAVLVADGPLVTREHLSIRLPEQDREMTVDIACGNKTLKLDFSADPPKLEEIEHEIILSALDYSKHNLSRAARILGISRDAIRYRLERYGKRNEGG